MRRTRAAWLIATAGAALALAGCARKPVELVESREAMDTLVTVRAIAPDSKTARAAIDAAWKEMDFAAKRLDRYTEDSDVSRVNRDAGGGFLTTVDPAVTSCLAAAKEAYDLTGGAFDPTVGPVLELWHKATERGTPPTEVEIQAALGLVGMDKVEIHAFGVDKAPLPGAPGTATREGAVYLVGLYKKGMMLDLGGVEKGYIAGRMARRMQQHGATAALVAAGGDVYALDERPANLVPPGGDPRWAVGVQDPRYPDDREKLYTALRLRDQEVSTSGHYERGYTVGGTRYSHIVNPRTGQPVNRHLASITIVGPDPAVADALATGIAVLGVEKGLALVETLPGVECLLLVIPESDFGQTDPAKVTLVPYRSSGFAALEFDPNMPAGKKD